MQLRWPKYGWSNPNVFTVYLRSITCLHAQLPLKECAAGWLATFNCSWLLPDIKFTMIKVTTGAFSRSIGKLFSKPKEKHGWGDLRVCEEVHVPTVVISDQGHEFVNQVETELLGLTGTQYRIATAYHPQTNGLTERFNQTLQSALLKVVNDTQ